MGILTQSEIIILNQYLLQSLNMGLSSIIQGETSYTNSFDCKVSDEGFYFIPRLPASYIIDNNFYQKIFLIANSALYPDFTLLKQNSAYFVPLKTGDIHTKRALFFPWKKGISERLLIANLNTYSSNINGNTIPIMKNLSINYNKVTSLAISGHSRHRKKLYVNLPIKYVKEYFRINNSRPKI